MAIPDTPTGWGLAEVIAEVSPATSDLVACFAAADPAQFDPAYEGSKNSLLNFRNYGAVTPELTISPTTANPNYLDGVFDITVTSNVGWTASDNAAWISIDPVGGSGNGTITVTYDTNNTSLQRVGTVFVTALGVPDRTCTITQQGKVTTSIQLRGPYAGSSQACGGSGLSTFYITGAGTWNTAVQVWTNPEATILASDGWYTDGMIARQQVDGMLVFGGVPC